MYYKVIKDGKVIDILDKLIYLKYQPKHNIMIQCTESDAQVFLSSDGKTAYHEESLYIPTGNPNGIPFDTVELEEIDKYEYEQLKILNLKTPNEIIDAFVMSLIEGGIL